MPSILVNNAASGGHRLISGDPWSGKYPQSVLRLYTPPTNSGSIYVGLSGGVTITSGGFPLSGGGGLDGMRLPPGTTYDLPRRAWAPSSGAYNVFVSCDPAASGGFARLYYEAM